MAPAAAVDPVSSELVLLCCVRDYVPGMSPPFLTNAALISTRLESAFSARSLVSAFKSPNLDFDSYWTVSGSGRRGRPLF
eukprot:scaffold51854_cov53-Phaeocystis_antarctica.AAC.3